MQRDQARKSRTGVKDRDQNPKPKCYEGSAEMIDYKLAFASRVAYDHVISRQFLILLFAL